MLNIKNYNMQDMTSVALLALEKTIQYQSALVIVADIVTSEKQKRRLYRAALKAEKAAKDLKDILSLQAQQA